MGILDMSWGVDGGTWRPIPLGVSLEVDGALIADDDDNAMAESGARETSSVSLPDALVPGRYPIEASNE